LIRSIRVMAIGFGRCSRDLHGRFIQRMRTGAFLPRHRTWFVMALTQANRKNARSSSQAAGPRDWEVAMVGIARGAFIAKWALIASAVGIGNCAAQEAIVAHVLAVRGSVSANSAGERLLLEVLDGIRERTRVELAANSELRICHYSTRTQLTLKGPLRAEVWADGLTAENAKAVERSNVPCMAPGLSGAPGGHISRGAKPP
jgi:hypothetical protein